MAIPDHVDKRGGDFSELTIVKPFGYFGPVFPVTVRVQGTTAATAANYTAPFFIAERPYQVIEVFERHETAGSDGNPVTVMLKKVPSGTAPGSGTDMLSAGISLKATANTNQKGTLSTTFGNTRLERDDSLALVTTGTLTAVAGVTLSVILRAI